MYWVYILLSQKDKKLYVGQAADIYKRLGLHFKGKVDSTKDRRPLVLIHKESHKTRGEAMQREQFLKSLWGGREKRKIVGQYFEKIKKRS